MSASRPPQAIEAKSQCPTVLFSKHSRFLSVNKTLHLSRSSSSLEMNLCCLSTVSSSCNTWDCSSPLALSADFTCNSKSSTIFSILNSQI